MRGRRFNALVMTPEAPLPEWFAALDAQLQDVPGLFADRPVVVDMSISGIEDRETLLIVLEGLEVRQLRLVGVEGAPASFLDGSRWSALASNLPGTNTAEAPRLRARAAEPAPPPAPPAPAPAPASSLMIDGPVRSGQSILFADGDVTVVGSIASGAEVRAGGSIHVYGALRGRAIAGLNPALQGRIFCRKMEAELVGVDRLYRTADHWGPELQGRAVQVRCDRGALRLTPID